MGQLAMKFPGIRVIAEDDVFEPVRSNFRCVCGGGGGSKVKRNTVLSKSKEFETNGERSDYREGASGSSNPPHTKKNRLAPHPPNKKSIYLEPFPAMNSKRSSQLYKDFTRNRITRPIQILILLILEVIGKLLFHSSLFILVVSPKEVHRIARHSLILLHILNLCDRLHI